MTSIEILVKYCILDTDKLIELAKNKLKIDIKPEDIDRQPTRHGAKWSKQDAIWRERALGFKSY